MIDGFAVEVTESTTVRRVRYVDRTSQSLSTVSSRLVLLAAGSIAYERPADE